MGKKKKHEKHEKPKKSKKSKKRKEKTSSSESDSASDTMEWVESKPNSIVTNPKRDEWMDADTFVPTYDNKNSDRKKKKLQKTEEDRLQEKKILESRELNPHWKNNGMGLPTISKVPESSVKTVAPSASVGDGGYGWLKKAYQRVKEQAEKEGRSMEEVASERWGSLKNLEQKLEEAKEKMLAMSGNSFGRDGAGNEKHSREVRYSFKKPNDDDSMHSRQKTTAMSGNQFSKDGDRNEKEHSREVRYSLKRPTDDDSTFAKPKTQDYRKYEDDKYKSRYHGGDKDKHHQNFDRPDDRKDRYGAWKRPKENDYPSHLLKAESKSSLDRDRSMSNKFKTPSDHQSQTDPSSSKDSSSQNPSWKKKSWMKDSAPPSTSKSLSDQTLNAMTSTSSSSIGPSIQSSDITQASSPKESETSSKIPQSSSSESDDDSETPMRVESKDRPILNQNELNYLAGRVLRAKSNDEPELAALIEKELLAAKERRRQFEESGGEVYDGFPRDEVIASEIDVFPLPKGFRPKYGKKKKGKYKDIYVTPLQTEHYGEDKYSLKDMFESEKASTIDDQMKMYFAAASKDRESLKDECDTDVSGKTAKQMDTYPSQEKDMHKFIQNYKKMDIALDKCHFCLDKPKLLKHTIIAKGEKVFLCAPPYKSLAEGHCFIVPINHVASTLLLDEDDYSEVDAFKRRLIKMFGDQKKCLVFMETSYKHFTYPHAVIECIPMPKEEGEMAPLYFKKAIDESEYEWAQNKKLIDLSKKNVRRSVPKGLPFFCVEFGVNGGFAHIIEDEKRFPRYFGKEIIGGMLEIDSYEIVKDRMETWQEISKKVLKLVELWEKYEDYFKS